MLTSVQSYDRIRQENLFENGKYAGDWLEIKSWATEKVESVFILYFTLKLHVEIPSPHSLWSRMHPEHATLKEEFSGLSTLQ